MPNIATAPAPAGQLEFGFDFQTRLRPTARPDEFIVKILPPRVHGPTCSVRDAMHRLGLKSPQSIYRLAKRGRLVVRQHGPRCKYRVDRASLDALAARAG